ncbi:hypothetical protein RFI_15534 [Reticulomyxa filosa]|uniref:Transmembrane protein n=1 Tax=Reticulomyxa filosa TaxID=46433 RepID=X6N6W5_RETFI|nr:hypothetical protein RFI_15534 [Reticulomyxa filosa]|eukprot:ETO21668.1 hypothetical protein RFI_15534 [Reticulomyxa filosa]
MATRKRKARHFSKSDDDAAPTPSTANLKPKPSSMARVLSGVSQIPWVMSSIVSGTKQALRDPEYLMQKSRDLIKYVDLGGEEIYYMFVGGLTFIFLSHIFSSLITYVFGADFFLFVFIDTLVVSLARLTLFIIFLWFAIAFVAFLWVLFFQDNAYAQTLRDGASASNSDKSKQQ